MDGSMGEVHDVIVAGAGHNSLIAAAYLSIAGFRCLVLEAREEIGGDTSTEELSLPGSATTPARPRTT